MSKTKALVYCSLFTALIAVGAFIRVPIPVLPFTLQYLFTMLAGLLRPVLLLPPGGLSEPALRYSLLHELTHLRRRDIWLKALALWVNALYWFNPLCWYMVRLVERDTELACDEAALRALPPEEHAAYGRTILDAAQRLKAGRAA